MKTNSNPFDRQNEDTMPNNPTHYKKGLDLAEAGRYQDALGYMQEHLHKTPGNAEALNDTGAILHCMGRSDEAIDHFVKARKIQDDSAEIVWNLAEAYLAIGKAGEAMRLFDDMHRVGVLNADVLNRTADIFLNQQNKGDAIEMLLRSLQIWPDQEVLRPMVEVIRFKRPKVAFFCDKDETKYIDDIVRFVKERFDLRFFQGQTQDQIHELMQWSDISWLQWGSDLAIAGSKQPKVCKNIVGLHRHEGNERWPERLNWANIDVLIAVGNGFAEGAPVHRVPEPEGRTSVVIVPSGVNLDKFDLINGPRGKNIAFVSDLKATSNPASILQCMQKLHYVDPEYRLFFGGDFKDAAIKQYMKHMVDALGLGEVVFFEGRQENSRSWLENKHYVVSTSISEHDITTLLEAMACGLKPVVHNFPGADRILPSEFLFNISEEFCEQICSEQYEPQRYRSFVEENYPMKSQLDRINRVLIEIEAEIELEPTDSSLCDDLQDRTPEETGLSAQPVVAASENDRIAQILTV
ncbi:MAG: glycosyltransferase [Planctomycetota bacterium]|nr:glycosyltransferase [Planctomycetota bacterium]